MTREPAVMPRPASTLDQIEMSVVASAWISMGGFDGLCRRTYRGSQGLCSSGDMGCGR